VVLFCAIRDGLAYARPARALRASSPRGSEPLSNEQRTNNAPAAGALICVKAGKSNVFNKYVIGLRTCGPQKCPQAGKNLKTGVHSDRGLRLKGTIRHAPRLSVQIEPEAQRVRGFAISNEEQSDV
jgi:hypothetical protein